MVADDVISRHVFFFTIKSFITFPRYIAKAYEEDRRRSVVAAWSGVSSLTLQLEATSLLHTRVSFTYQHFQFQLSISLSDFLPTYAWT